MANNGNWLSRSSYMPLVRKHVDAPFWGIEAGTDFWLVPGLLSTAAAATTNIQNLTEAGWTATALTDTVGGGADFIASAGRAPNHILTDASSDLLHSPVIFGDYDHAWQAMRIAGMNSMPKKLVLEFMGSMTVASNDDQGTGWGFIEDGGSIVTEADHVAVISSDGTNFQLASNGGASALTDAGAVDDTSWHLWTIEMALGPDLAYWYIDGTLQGSVAVLAGEAPFKFGFGVEAGSTGNRCALGITHIYYSWSGVGSDLGNMPSSAAD